MSVSPTETEPRVYWGQWQRFADMERDFQAKLPGTVLVLFAYYDVESYEGNAFVLYRKNGKLFEVHGSHCSCKGLEGQWEPEQTSVRYLKTMYNDRWGPCSWLECLPEVKAGLLQALAPLKDK